MRTPNPTKILTRNEVLQVISHLHRPGLDRYPLRRQNLTIFRLACGCGLRVSEIAALTIGDLTLEGARPAVQIRNGKGGKSRTVPLWWDAGTLGDIRNWRDELVGDGCQASDPVVAGQVRTGGERKALDRWAIGSRWSTAISILGSARAKQLPIHAGRHSFISHALLIGRSLAEVRDAAGHSSVKITDLYTHALASMADLPDMFAQG